MSILPAMQSAAIRLIGQRPSTFFGGDDTFTLEISDLVNEVAQDIAKYQDWQGLVTTAEVIGDGVTGDYPLPADYDRMTQTADVQDVTDWMFGYFRYRDINAFMLNQAAGFQPFPGGWIIYGDRLRFSPVIPYGQSAQFPYVSKNWAIAENGQPKAAFDNDLDSFVLPDRLLTLGLVWRWREGKKLDASGDQEAFVKALDEYAAKDGGSRQQRRNARTRVPGVAVGWPWPLGG